ncbi:M15 family metallopeptidase [bacterium]|nr:M15 family metallopeptidase [bacterium]
MNHLELTGQTRDHIRQYENPRFAAHPEAAQAFFALKEAAAKDGILLHPFSAFRDFKTQLRIWNQKFNNERPLYTVDGIPMEFSRLNEKEIISAILGWSALPGGSRHHWGTDIDVIDKAAVSDDYRVMLLPEEIQKGGVFYRLHCWLDKNISRFGFFRPYSHFQGGIFPESWHLSYRSLADKALSELSFDIIEQTIVDCDIGGKNSLLELLPEIYSKYILNISQ